MKKGKPLINHETLEEAAIVGASIVRKLRLLWEKETIRYGGTIEWQMFCRDSSYMPELIERERLRGADKFPTAKERASA